MPGRIVPGWSAVRKWLYGLHNDDRGRTFTDRWGPANGPTANSIQLVMLTIPHCKESLSRAYVTAVVGRSRNNLVWGREYDYGVDGSVRILESRGPRVRETGFGFDFQSKSTTVWDVDASDVVYDLEA